MKKLIAVITADIVNSSALEKSQLEHLVKRIKKLAGREKTRVTFYRGDSFQCYLEDPGKAYLFALRLRTETILSGRKGKQPIDLRISVGFGDSHIPAGKASESMSEPFIISGRELDNMEHTGRRFMMSSGNKAANITLDTISQFTDFLFVNLTLKQAEVMKHLLEDKTQQKIAKELKKTQSTINRHAGALGWKEFERLAENCNRCISLIPSANES